MWWGDAQLMKDAAETEYLHFSETRTKTGNGADPCPTDQTKAFATPH